MSKLHADRGYVVSLLVLAVVAAPIAEEIVFRGVVLRGLLSTQQEPWSRSVCRELLFGLAHFDPIRGMGNIGLIMVLSAVGCVLGGAAFLFRRIAPTMIAHAILNGVALAMALSGLVPQDLRTASEPSGGEGEVVDQADVAEPGRGHHDRRAIDLADRFERQRIDDRGGTRAWPRGSASIRRVARAIRAGRVAFALDDCVRRQAATPATTHTAARRSSAVSRWLRLEIARPSGSRTVGTLDDLDVDVEVGDHPADDRQLLESF